MHFSVSKLRVLATSGICLFTLLVAAENLGARALYERLGFTAQRAFVAAHRRVHPETAQRVA